MQTRKLNPEFNGQPAGTFYNRTIEPPGQRKTQRGCVYFTARHWVYDRSIDQWAEHAGSHRHTRTQF
jgi:hypothetical protein